LSIALVGCSSAQLPAKAEAERDLPALQATPLYKMKPTEVGRYLGYLHGAEPSLRARVANLARKNIGQPYELYLLGEFPYQTTDDQPLFRLDKSDCVVFVEHTYAMALSSSWEEFFWMLQRIRYKDGVIGVATRNHYTETDWDVSNAWLVSDISAELGGDRAASYTMDIDRQGFLKRRYHLDVSIPVEHSTQTYVPKTVVADVAAGLQTGDFVNVISESTTKPEEKWASHVGLVIVAENGERHILHSSEPMVREETFASFIDRAEKREAAAGAKGTKRLAGFKFLRLNENPDVPPMAPQPRPGH
jgi:hypothetical protein